MPALLRRALFLSAAALGVALSPAPALAQDAATKKAQPLFDEATAEMDKGNYASACPKLEEVTRIAPQGVGAKETLAECYEKQGRLASAVRQYNAAAEAAQAQKKPDRAKEATAHAAELKPRVPTLTLQMAEPPAGTVVRLDGVVLDGEPWKTPALVDPGKFKLEVSAPGRKAFSTTVEIKGERAAVKIAVPALELDSATVTTAAASSEGSAAPVVVPSDAAGGERPGAGVNGRFVGGLVTAGVGVASLALGVVSTLQIADAQSSIEGYRKMIPPNQSLCDASTQATLTGVDQQKIRDACGKSVFGPLQFVFYGLGVVSGGAAVYLFATSRSKPSGPAVTALSPAIGQDRGGLILSGSW